MRLIDADALLQRVNELVVAGSYMKTWLNVVINEQPTVKVKPIEVLRPVRHGHWIDRNGAIVAPFWERYECSECGARSDNSNYCHNCGAKMDAERKEE